MKKDKKEGIIGYPKKYSRKADESPIYTHLKTNHGRASESV